MSFSRLYFEQKNFERHGWDLGYITPFVCAGSFFWDTALLPYHMGVQPFRKFDTAPASACQATRCRWCSIRRNSA